MSGVPREIFTKCAAKIKKIAVPADTRQYVRYATRFQIGDNVLCDNGEKCVEGVVADFALEIGTTRVPYKIALSRENGAEWFAPQDQDHCIRRKAMQLRPKGMTGQDHSLAKICAHIETESKSPSFHQRQKRLPKATILLQQAFISHY